METPDTVPQTPVVVVPPVKEKKKRGRKPKPKDPDANKIKICVGNFPVSFN